MNIFVLFASCMVIISYTFAIPFSKHIRNKVPLSKRENPNYQGGRGLTALRVLEEQLLKRNKDNFNNLVLSPNNGRRTATTFNSCFAAFGKSSPLCYCRRHRRSDPGRSISKTLVTRPFFPMKRFLGPTSHPVADHSVVEDFFGIFATNSSSVSNSVQKSDTEASFSSLNNKTPFSMILNPRSVSSIPITDRFKPSFENLEVEQVPHDKIRLQGKFEPSFNERSKFDSADILPHNRSLRSQANKTDMLLIERIGDTKQHLNQLSKREDEFNNNDNGDNSLMQFNSEGSPSSSTYSLSDNFHSELETTTLQIPETHMVPTTTAHNTEVGPDLDNSSPNSDKKDCEKRHGKPCVCDFKSLEKDIRDIFQQATDTKTIYQEISKINCKSYVPKPDIFQLTSYLKPKVLSANRKPMTVDEANGPKEIDSSSLENFIKESASVDDEVLFVFVNVEVFIPCFPTNDVHLSASDADNVIYTWTRDGKPITGGQVTEMKAGGDGTLKIQSIGLIDAGVYTCKVDYINPDTGQHREDTFSHNVNVVTLPIVTVRVPIHYRAPATCDASVLEEFQLYLPQLVEEALCSSSSSKRLCIVEVHSPVCHTKTNASSERPYRELATNESSTKRISSWLQDKIERAYNIGAVVDVISCISQREKRETSLEMSLNLEVYIHRAAEKELSNTNASLCDANCHLLLTFKLLQLFKENMQDIVNTPVSTMTDKGVTLFTPVENSRGIKYIFGCIGGYHLNKGFCSPCPKSTYSEDGDTECYPCPPHTYQGGVGARRCIPCTLAWMPTCNEYIENVNVVIIFLIVIIVLILLACFILYYLLFVRHKSISDIKKKLVPKPKDRERKVKIAKAQRKAKEQYVPMKELDRRGSQRSRGSRRSHDSKASRDSVISQELEELVNSSPGESEGEELKKKETKPLKRSSI